MKRLLLSLLIPFSVNAQLKYNTYKNFYYSTEKRPGLNSREYNQLASIVAQVIQTSYMAGHSFSCISKKILDALEENGSVAAITLRDDLKLMW